MRFLGKCFNNVRIIIFESIISHRLCEMPDIPAGARPDAAAPCAKKIIVKKKHSSSSSSFQFSSLSLTLSISLFLLHLYLYVCVCVPICVSCLLCYQGLRARKAQWSPRQHFSLLDVAIFYPISNRDLLAHLSLKDACNMRVEFFHLFFCYLLWVKELLILYFTV